MATKERTLPTTLKNVTNTEWPINQNTEKVFDLKSKSKVVTSKGEEFLSSEPLEIINREDLSSVTSGDLQVEKVVNKSVANPKQKALAKRRTEVSTKPRKSKTTNTRQFAQVQQLANLEDNVVSENNTNERLKQQMLISNQKVEDDMQFTQLIQLASLGLYKLFLKGSSNVLNPLAFLVENKAILFRAAWILVMPILFTMLAFSNSASLAAKVTNINMVLSATYYTVFYFASLFVWVSSLVMLKGVFHIFKKTLVDVARKEQV